MCLTLLAVLTGENSILIVGELCSADKHANDRIANALRTCGKHF